MLMLSRQAIVDQLENLVGKDRVITDEPVLKENSVDRYRKVQTVFGFYELPLPAAVVKPMDAHQVSAILKFAHRHGINCVPKTGGSATEGGLETIVENSIVVDGSDMNRIIEINPVSMLVTAQCGVNLEVLESALRRQGLTTGHSPQSKPLAMMGGLVATRSIGQFSTLYGGIEDMVVGLEAVFPNGVITRIKNVPRRACGPDIRHVIIGNEGALCYITEVTLRVYRFYPENNRFLACAMADMASGLDLLREVITAGYRPSIARLYDAQDGPSTDSISLLSTGACSCSWPKVRHPLARATAGGIEAVAAR
jgi:alkyldihydroxyacetonephosphate synthase